MTLSTLDEPATSGTTCRGRPRDVLLTHRLVDAASDIVVDRGLAGLTVDTLIARTGAGRSGVYRRWRCVDDLVRHVVTTLDLVPAPPATGHLVDDLVTLLGPFRHPLDRGERFVAAVWGAAQHDPALDAALDARMVRPLEDAVRLVAGAHAARTAGVPAWAVDQLVVVVQALWLQRLLGTRPPLPAMDLDSLVRDVLAPIVTGRPTPPTLRRGALRLARTAAGPGDRPRLVG